MIDDTTKREAETAELLPDDPHIISEMTMAFISGYHWPREIRDFESDPKTERGMKNVLALLVDKGYSRASLATPAVPDEPSRDMIRAGLRVLNCSAASWEDRNQNIVDIFKAMKSAAPKQDESVE